MIADTVTSSATQSFMRCAVVAGLAAAMACSKSSPAAPGSATGSTISVPAADSPVDGAALTTLRSTLVVRNAAAEQAGTKLYEFQISDRTDFSSSGAPGAFPVAARKSGMAEGSGGAT